MFVPGDRPGTDMRRPEAAWWKKDKRSMHSAVFSAVQYIDEIQSGRRNMGLSNLQMYSARLASSFGVGNFQNGAGDTARIKLNVVKSAIDTIVAHIATEKYRPMYLGNGASYEEKHKAQLLTKYMLGQFLYLKRHEKSLAVFRDAAIFGRGYEKFYEDPMQLGAVASERVFPDDIIFDEEETKNGAPRSLYQHKEVAAEVLAARFPQFEKSIMKAARIRTDGDVNFSIHEPVSVLESWHLPSGPNAKDGRHAITISNRTLYVDDWKWRSFPFSSCPWGVPLLGWLPISAAEELTSIQIEVNYIAQKIQRLMTLATSMVWKERGSDVGKISNREWGQYEYTGKPPIFQNISAVSAEYFHHLDRLYQRAFELVGVSLLSAQGNVPGNLESGAALRNYNNITAKRYQHINQMFENYHMESAERIYDTSCDIRAAGRDVGILVPGEDEFEKVLFSKGYLERNKFLIQAYPTPLLPEEPAGRLDDIATMAQSMPQVRGRLPLALAGYSDMKEVVAPLVLPYRIAEKQVDNILRGEEYEPPFAEMNLSIARETAQVALLDSHRMKDINSDKRTVLRRYIAQIDDLLQDQQMAAMPNVGSVAPPMQSPTLTAVPQQGPQSAPPQIMGA